MNESYHTHVSIVPHAFAELTSRVCKIDVTRMIVPCHEYESVISRTASCYKYLGGGYYYGNWTRGGGGARLALRWRSQLPAYACSEICLTYVTFFFLHS